MPWQAKQYDSFKNERSEPIEELLNRVPNLNYTRIYDLGCGSGAAIDPLKRRWPNAELVAIDNDKNMLETAKKKHPSVKFELCDILSFIQKIKPQKDTLIFSNAALHWLDDHKTLFPSLMSLVKNNGCLAVQMPNNWQEPSHVEMANLAKSKPFDELLSEVIREMPVLSRADYEEILNPIATNIEIWGTTYQHELKGKDPVISWLLGSSLKFYLDNLPNNHKENFKNKLAERLNIAYPKNQKGCTMFPFNRLFIVAS